MPQSCVSLINRMINKRRFSSISAKQLRSEPRLAKSIFETAQTPHSAHNSFRLGSSYYLQIDILLRWSRSPSDAPNKSEPPRATRKTLPGLDLDPSKFWNFQDLIVGKNVHQINSSCSGECCDKKSKMLTKPHTASQR